MCQDKQCKDNKVKLLKGELRFATWVEIKEHGSWRYKHWYVRAKRDEKCRTSQLTRQFFYVCRGCVSGQQIENLRDAIAKGDGEYDFDAIDGYDEMG